MPIPGARYRVVQTSKGPVRLAFKGKTVVEAKNLKTGALHSVEEFARDHQRAVTAKMRAKMQRKS